MRWAQRTRETRGFTSSKYLTLLQDAARSRDESHIDATRNI